jgi:hypothetical protein
LCPAPVAAPGQVLGWRALTDLHLADQRSRVADPLAKLFLAQAGFIPDAPEFRAEEG